MGTAASVVMRSGEGKAQRRRRDSHDDAGEFSF